MHDLIIRRIPVGGGGAVEDLRMDWSSRRKNRAFCTICNCSLAKLRSTVQAPASYQGKATAQGALWALTVWDHKIYEQGIRSICLPSNLTCLKIKFFRSMCIPYDSFGVIVLF